MRTLLFLAALLAAVLSSAAGATTGAPAASVAPRFELGVLERAPFPTDFWTVSDADQITGLRVALPRPDCAQRPSDCADADVLNRLDGFNLNPRLSIPFSGDIDASSVTSETVFLLPMDGGPNVAINQVVWDTLSRTLHAEADLTLRQATRYALVVTTGVLDSSGQPIVASEEFRRFRHNLVPENQRYKKAILDALFRARHAGTPEQEIAAVSVFTTQSISPAMEAVRDYLRSLPAPVADFRLAPNGGRTVFARASIESLSYSQQTRASPPAFTNVNIGLAPLNFVPGAVGSIAYGRIDVANFLQPDLTLGTVGTKMGVPPVAGTNELYFNLYVPSGAKPAAGWPVAVIGPGALQNKEGFSVLLAAKLAEAGIASLGINPVARGFGPLSTNTVTLVGGERVTFLAGGRGSDRNGDNVIGPAEGADATGPDALLASRDTAKQTIFEHVQLARAIEAGVDVDGDGVADLDPDRISFIGWSFGSNYGVPVVALDPAYRTAVFSAVGGPLIDNRRLGANRNIVGAQLAARTPSLINLSGTNFNDNFPLRDQAPVVNTVAGAMAIQDYIDRNEWAQQSGDIVPFAIHLRSQPLAGSSARAVLINIAKGDQTVPNPAASKVIRAGGLEDTTMFYRHDLAFAANPLLPSNPHPFMTLITNAAFAPLSRQVEHQAAQFLASEGAVVTQPQPAAYFEIPIPLPLPETLNFLP